MKHGVNVAAGALPGLPEAGLALALLAYSLLSCQDAAIKWLVATVPVPQALFCRSVVVLAACVARGGPGLLRHALRTPRRAALLGRGVVTLAAWLCYFTAARRLPLGQLQTLYFCAPVIVVLLAGPLLGERVTWSRLAAVTLGFVGACLASGAADLAGPPLAPSPAVLLVIAAALLWALGVILTRRIARDEPSIVQMLCTNAVFLVGTGAASAAGWAAVTGRQAALLLLVAVLGGLGQLALFESARRVPASLSAPLEYVGLVWAFSLGFLVWGDVPRPGVVFGAALIVGAGLGLLAAERRRPPLPASTAGAES